MPRKGDKKQWPFIETTDPYGLVLLMRAYLSYLRVRAYSEGAVKTSEWSLAPFVFFCHERSLTRASEVTRSVIERYQRHLYHQRKADGQPLSVPFQHRQLSHLRVFFRWLCKSHYIPSNPAADIELPRCPVQLPAHVLSEREAEKILGEPDLSNPLGVRDRAILETFYSTGIRRRELAHLKLYDVDFSRGSVMIRQGKGKKDRVVPIGERALGWIGRYLSDARPALIVEPDEGWLFLAVTGGAFNLDALTTTVRQYVRASGTGKKGSCHLFRHTAATLMLEGGADVRYVQEMLGHAKLDTTQIYTRVSITKLKAIHTATHPGALVKQAARAEEGGQEAESDVVKGEATSEATSEDGEP